jgi:hypothetical protein
MWYKFTAFNSETRYGWTPIPAVADAALAWLNKGREINVYSVVSIGGDENETDGATIKLADRDDLICIDDTSVDDFSDDA